MPNLAATFTALRPDSYSWIISRIVCFFEAVLDLAARRPFPLYPFGIFLGGFAERGLHSSRSSVCFE